MWRRLAPERTAYYRFFNRRKLRLPADLRESLSALGDLRYDPRSKRGILFASPFRLGGAEDSWRPAKLAVLLLAEGRSDLFALERAFRARFES